MDFLFLNVVLNNLTVESCMGLDWLLCCQFCLEQNDFLCLCLDTKNETTLCFVTSSPTIIKWLTHNHCRLLIFYRMNTERKWRPISRVLQSWKEVPICYVAAAAGTEREGGIGGKSVEGRRVWQVTLQTGWFCHFSSPRCHFYSHLQKNERGGKIAGRNNEASPGGDEMGEGEDRQSERW